jgi:membrane-anchored glycerophosphoryl diester phosphodiesterase (GDPDase)
MKESLKKEKKKETLMWIKRFGRLSTTRLLNLLNISLASTKELLDEMAIKDKTIIKEEETNSIYWSEKK